MKLGMTGTSSGMTFRQAKTFKSVLEACTPEEFIHGDCVGADDEAATIARMVLRSSVKIIAHPCIIEHMCAYNPYFDQRHAAIPPLDRNRVIVNSSTGMVAFPYEYEEQQRGGTWYTIRYAKKVHRPLIIIFPDGSTDFFPKGTA